jgi:hypothetical protein
VPDARDTRISNCDLQDYLLPSTPMSVRCRSSLPIRLEHLLGDGSTTL